MGYIGVTPHLLAIVGHMFTKSAHQPLGNFKSKNPMGKLLLLGFVCRLSSASHAVTDQPSTDGAKTSLHVSETETKKILDHLAQGAPTTNRILMWWASRGTFVICPLVLNLFPLCHWLSHRELCAKKNTWKTAGLSGRVQDHPEQYCILTSRSRMFCETTRIADVQLVILPTKVTSLGNSQGPSSPPKDKILWKKKCTENIIPFELF